MGNDLKKLATDIRSLDRLPTKDDPFIFFDLGLTPEEKQAFTELSFFSGKCYDIFWLQDFYHPPSSREYLYADLLPTITDQSNLSLVVDATFRVLDDFQDKMYQFKCNASSGTIRINGDSPYGCSTPLWHKDGGYNDNGVIKEMYRFITDLKGKTHTWFLNATAEESSRYDDWNADNKFVENTLEEQVMYLDFPLTSESKQVNHAEDFGGAIFSSIHSIHTAPVYSVEEVGRLLVTIDFHCS